VHEKFLRDPGQFAIGWPGDPPEFALRWLVKRDAPERGAKPRADAATVGVAPTFVAASLPTVAVRDRPAPRT
jgi:hypothetical protein